MPSLSSQRFSTLLLTPRHTLLHMHTTAIPLQYHINHSVLRSRLESMFASLSRLENQKLLFLFLLCVFIFFLKRYKRKGKRPISASLVVTRLLFQGRLPTLLCVHLVQRLFLLFYSSYYRPTFQPIVFWN